MNSTLSKILACCLALPLAARAVVFTTDTTIAPDNFTYEGAAIVVSNATLTVDGPHTFASLLVGANGIVTHSFSASGTITTNQSIADEPQILVGTNEVSLASLNVITASVVVKDLSATITYQTNLDFVVRGTVTNAFLSRSETSTIPDGAMVLVSYAIPGGTITAGLNLAVTGNVEVAPGGFINANGRGFGGNTGTGNGGEVGAPQTGAGAGHGGYGGLSSSNAPGGNTYGGFNQPAALGSGGGQGVGGVGGAGGGNIKLTVSGTAQIDGGISANALNATNSRSGGGSGGSIWITAQTLGGTGAITAHGGNGEPIHGGGGGGGRIAIYSDTNDFSGTIAAYGGTGWRTGGAGTIFTQVTTNTGLLLLDNGGRFGTNSSTTLTGTPDVIIRNGARLIPSGTLTARDVTVGSNGLIAVVAPTATLSITARNFTLESGGMLLADNAGYAANNGIGTPNGTTAGSSLGGGGGHAGYGGNGAVSNANGVARGGFPTGTQSGPISFGGGGGGFQQTGSSSGGPGGGAIRLNISSSLLVDGKISANGGSGITTGTSGSGGGGGAGGSIWLSALTFGGAGTLTANGGDGLLPVGGGGGGGGRIAVTFNTNTFTGSANAFGGAGANAGGAGTLYFRTNGNNSERLLLNNGGRIGAPTPVTSFGSQDLTVSDGANGEVASSSASWRNLWIKTNSSLTVSYISPPGQINVNFSGNVTIDAGGILTTSGRGYTGGQGTGSGSSSSAGARGGGSHGGFGGIGGNGAYGLVMSPTTAGSGGGNASGTTASPFGGAGGGALRMTFSGQNNSLIVNGTLSADGLGGQIISGGGAGGSLWLSPLTLSGTGKITANGGAGNGPAGGGGGGRISINYASNSFTGTITAYGGPGGVAGGAGTIYLRPNNVAIGQVILDNGGLIGTNTPISSAYSFPTPRYDLTLTGAASALVFTSQQLSNLTVTANSIITMRTNETNIFLDVLRNATITTGSAINVNGHGFGRGAGNSPGFSLASKGAGGGHGGAGGNSASGALGGTNYGAATQPVLRGSGGGAGANTYINGCEGGGAVRLIVGGTLDLTGSLTANGNSGIQDDSGGGAGGSILVTAGRLIGDGFISATGGAGDLFGGGGGGGGRVAIYCPTNQFTGLYDVTGGSGFVAGEMGTVFLSASLGPLLSIAGTVTDGNGQPVAGVTLSTINPGAPNVTNVSDANGNYLLAIPSGWIGSVVPSYSTNVFVPSLRSYNTTVTSLNGQNFTMLPSVTPTLTTSLVGTNLQLSWAGVTGVQYWLHYSTNLTDWNLLSGPVIGTNGVTHNLPLTRDLPAKFFRIWVTY